MKQLENIRSKFDSFMEQVESDSTSGSEILTEAFNQVEDALKGEITPELAHLANEIYEYMGGFGWERRITLHRRYLNVTPNNEERFWAHWHLVESLAILQKNRETIEEQTRLYDWTCEHMPDEYVLEVLYDTTQANCWKEEGRVDEWFQFYEKASERLENPEVGPYKRCLFLQAGAEVLMSNDRLDDALLGMEKLERANNAPDWEHYFRFWLAVITGRLRVYSKQEEWDRFNQVFMEASAFIEREMEKRNAGEFVDIGNLTWAAHDVGCCLVKFKKYNEAKRLLRIAIALDNHNDWGHFCLAASIWASEKDREKTLHHLKVTRDCVLSDQDRYYKDFLETPEFSDVKDDEEFLKVLGQK